MNKVKRLIISLCLSGILLVAMLPQVIAADKENLNSLPNCTFSVKTGARAGEPAVIYNSDGVALYCLDMSLDMAYSTVYLNIRKGPTTESEIVDTVAPGYYFTRIAHSDFGWDLVLYESSYYFVWNEYLSETKPEIKVEEIQIQTQTSTPAETYSSSAQYSAGTLRSMGVLYWNGYRWTWYSEKVLPGGGLNIPGRHVDSNGYVCDGNGYICLASSDLSKGTIVSTPFGKSGKIYDSGCASGTLDVYVSW